jgi:RNA polymerase sigma factor for flagellar operon FliA
VACRPKYPQNLRRILRHAERFSKLLVRLEHEQKGAWLVGRSGELRAVVSSAVADWRTRVLGDEQAAGAMTSYMDGLHRKVAKRLRRNPALECCRADDAITAVPEDPLATSVASVVQLEAVTTRAGWVDSPEVLARFQSELAKVEIEARVFKKQLRTGCVTLDDLRGFGREGLLDAARSFDPRRGVPFSHWAALRIRNGLIDGVRHWGLSRRALGYLRALEQTGAGWRPNQEPQDAGTRRAQAPDDGGDDLRALVPAAAIAPTDEEQAREGGGEPAPSPEDLVAGAELRRVLGELLKRLPDRERRLVEGCYFDGLTLKQAAAEAGITQPLASRTLARALGTIKRRLRAHGVRGLV